MADSKKKILSWERFQWHVVHAEFYENWSTKSGIEQCSATFFRPNTSKTRESTPQNFASQKWVQKYTCP
jgi:hypothetical protein